MFEIVGNCLIGKVAQAVVVAVVTDVGGEFGLRTQRVLSLIGEEAIEFRASRFQSLLRGMSE